MNSFSSALTNMRRSPYQSLASVLLLSFTFFVAYSLSLFMLGSQKVLQFFETRPQVIAFFQLETNVASINELANTIQDKPYVTGINLVSQEEALAIYQEENRDDPLLLELVTSQILPASIEVSGETIDDLERIKEDLSTNSIIEEVVLQEDVIQSLANWTRAIRLAGIASVVILGSTSLLIMAIVIGMKVVTKRPAINIMRVIGASKWFIRSPFVFEGILYGLASSLLGWTGAFVSLLYLTPWIKDFVGPVPLFPIQPALFALQVSLGSLIGMFLGALAGAIAVSRIIRN